MSKIIVAGAGHGGLVAAARLAAAGHSVTVLEKCGKGSVGHCQKDAFDNSAAEFARLNFPVHFKAPKNRLTFIGGDRTAEPVTLPAVDEGTSLWADRRELAALLIAQAQSAGAKIIYECEVEGASVLGDRVVGVKTRFGTLYADLVIDACGVNSPVRRSLPSFTMVQNELGRFDRLFTYRAFHDKVPGVPEPETRYNIYLDRDGVVGFEWLITEEDNADMLIARFYEPAGDEIAAAAESVCKENPHIAAAPVSEGARSVIPVRQPLAVFVADGYAAVGDSACMTSPVKGSGINNSLQAGAILAETVIEDADGFYRAETLWEYEREYFKTVGFDSCRLALLKNALPYITADDIKSFTGRGVLTNDELELLSADALAAVMSSKGINAIREKLKIFADFPELKSLLLDMARWFGKWAVIEPFFPQKYEREAVEKWAVRYNEFFDGIKYNGEKRVISE